MFCFYNDQVVGEDAVAISVNDRGFSLADGVFDTQLFTPGNLNEDVDLHFERLAHDAAVIGIELSKTTAELKTIASMLLARNAISSGRWAIRTQVTRGIALRGLMPPETPNPTLIMRIMPAPPVDEQPVRAIISQTTRRNEHSPLSRIKSLNYADNILALMEAKDSGADDAILLNSEGFVTCATSSNIFIVENGQWITPPVMDGVLPGITRLRLIAEKNAIGESITGKRLQTAGAIWQCNSVIGLRKVVLV